MHRIERPKSLTELVTTALRDEIVGGELDLGAALSEAGIAKRLDVSRTPVREAFARLELEGLVRTEPQRGTFVITLTARELADICDVRECLETHALKSAHHHDKPGLLSELGAIVEEMTNARQDENDRRYLALDTAFHQTLFDHTGNRFLNDAYQTIAHKMAALRNRLGMHPPHMEKSYNEHQQIVEALKRDDVEAAVAQLNAHIGRKEGSYWQLATEDEFPFH